jgi:hypothetical protein
VCIYGMAETNAQLSNALIILRELDARLRGAHPRDPLRPRLLGFGLRADIA